jgi:hypothetical protein
VIASKVLIKVIKSSASVNKDSICVVFLKLPAVAFTMKKRYIFTKLKRNILGE